VNLCVPCQRGVLSFAWERLRCGGCLRSSRAREQRANELLLPLSLDRSFRRFHESLVLNASFPGCDCALISGANTQSFFRSMGFSRICVI
jgi:hypothetical protein